MSEKSEKVVQLISDEKEGGCLVENCVYKALDGVHCTCESLTVGITGLCLNNTPYQEKNIEKLLKQGDWPKRPISLWKSKE